MGNVKQILAIFLGYLFAEPTEAAISTCTTNAPVGGIFYDKYCWDTQYCCSREEKVCCNNGEVCSGSSCLNIGLFVGCAILAIGLIITIVVVICICKNKNRRQTGVVISQNPSGHPMQSMQPGQIISTSTTSNQGYVQQQQLGIDQPAVYIPPPGGNHQHPQPNPIEK